MILFQSLEYREEDGAMIGEDGKSIGYKVTEEYFKTQLEKNAQNILTGLTDREVIRLYNNTLDKGTKSDFDYNQPLDKDDRLLAQEALVNSLMNETKRTKSIFAQVTEKKKDVPKTSTNKLTYAQLIEKERVKDREKVFSEYIDKGTEGDRYTIPAKNNSSIQAIKKEAFNKDGKSEGDAWFLQQKSGSSWKDISPGYSDIKFIAENLGYTIPKSGSKGSKKDGKKDGNYSFDPLSRKVVKQYSAGGGVLKN